MDKYKNKYRISSARLQNWDYGSNGSYFITICTKNQLQYFGKIEQGKMILNTNGIIAQNFWIEIPKHFPFVELGNFVVMPNHTHGILIIDKNGISNNNSAVTVVETLQCNVSTTVNKIPKNGQMSKISPKPGSISTIIRSYKSVVSRYIKLDNKNFAWQARFHDHIIRNEHSFDVIQNYIANNPSNWDTDKFYPLPL